jgi:RNA polymerase sigma-70 factor, ECF subfamily
VQKDFSVLRNFRGNSSLATYLTVVARRIVVKELLARMSASRLGSGSAPLDNDVADPRASVEQRLSNREEVERLLGSLHGAEAQVVRMYHLEGRSYQEIGTAVGMPENSIGPILSRARNKLRRAGIDSVTQ